MKICYHCKKRGFQAEKFFALQKPLSKSICLGCAVAIYLMIKAYIDTGKGTTGKLDAPKAD